ncbi:hypothetical protein LZ32DRAFT_305220 [Colletotrichum eremochloae]|nr:hypothetical protein LZ32DRAFT_305220 [Colletotrichum eremochloae]
MRAGSEVGLGKRRRLSGSTFGAKAAGPPTWRTWMDSVVLPMFPFPEQTNKCLLPNRVIPVSDRTQITSTTSYTDRRVRQPGQSQALSYYGMRAEASLTRKQKKKTGNVNNRSVGRGGSFRRPLPSPLSIRELQRLSEDTPPLSTHFNLINSIVSRHGLSLLDLQSGD